MRVLTVFFGHFLLLGEDKPPPPYLWLGTWERFLGLLGYRTEAVRLMLSRACRSGLFIKTREGRRVYYRPTQETISGMYWGGYRVYQQEEAPWNNRWLCVSCQALEEGHELRECLTHKLCRMGFGHFGHSLWLSPYDLRPVLEEALKELGLSDRVITFWATEPNRPPAELAAQAWELPKMAERYQVLIGELERIYRGVPAEPDGERSVAAIIEAEVRYGAVAIMDPHLPSSLLPAGWPGQEARNALHRLGERVNRRAWDFFHQMAITTPYRGRPGDEQTGIPEESRFCRGRQP